MADERLIETRLNKKGKPSIIHWGGLLYGLDRYVRLTAFASIVILSVSMSLMQLGFVGIGTPGNYAGYMIALLAPITLGSLLLGLWQGTLVGFISGGVLFLHSRLQPLDYYEVTFVTPLSSIALFTVTAFFFGLLLAIALRKVPSVRRQIIYIAIICYVSSVMFTLAFVVNVIINLIVQIVGIASEVGAEVDVEDLTTYAFSTAGQLGSSEIQVHLDALLMFAVCTICLLITRKALANKTSMGLHAQFRAWLLLVAALAWMLTAGLSFAVITEQSKAAAHDGMVAEIEYLLVQLRAYDARIAALETFLDSDKKTEQAVSDEQTAELNKIVSIDNLLSGYTVDSDGIIVIFKDEKVLLSDDPSYTVGSDMADYFIADEEIVNPSSDGETTGDMLQITYDSNVLTWADAKDFESRLSSPVSAQVAYMCVGRGDGYTIFSIYPSTMVFQGRDGTRAWAAFSAFVQMFVVFFFISRLLAHGVVRRIDETNTALGRITDGDLNARVEVTDSREFASLSAGINTTVDALKGWIAEAESRMDAELAAAKAIQESALPRTFPPFPDISRFDIYASMQAAREVGGDFYDFFLIGDDCGANAGKLGFVIADVSGKGVPAALFMMAARTEIRNFVGSGMELGEAVENANRQLCEGNDAGMFVTAFVGVLDYATGHVTYVNAGHNPPLLWRKGSWEWVTEKSGLPLGLFDGLPYTAFEFDCSIGDQILTYTDGVTEAMSVDDALYGEDRLMALAQENFALHPRRLVRTLRSDVASHAAGAEQSDDITILALEYGVPPELTATLTLPAIDTQLPKVNEFIHSELDRRRCPVRTQHQLDIAVEELFVNVCHYAYPDATPETPGQVRVSYTYSADPPSIVVEIADEGTPYNPLKKPDAVTPENIADVPIGGLGILMAKQSVDTMSYERVDGSNIVTITKRW